MPDRLQGKRVFWYWSDTDPSSGTGDPEDPANYTLVGALESASDDSTWSTSSIIDRENQGYDRPSLDSRSETAELTCNRKLGDAGSEADDAGQLLLRDNHVNGTEGYWLKVVVDDTDTPISGMEAKHGAAFVTDWGGNDPTAGASQFTFSIQSTEPSTTFTIA